jgi:predicted ester cyclase
MHKFHSIAALCGDGLRPELRELFERLAIDPRSGLRIRHDGMIQAGPDPVSKASTRIENRNIGGSYVSKESDNKAIVGRWFTDFWGETCNLNIVDELAAPDMLLQYSLHEPRRGRDDIKAFMTDFRKAFPNLNFWGTADLIAEGDYVVGRWEGGGTHTGAAFRDFLAGSLPANTGRKMKFTGTTVLKLKDGMIVEEIGLDDGVVALTQLGLIKTAA